MKSIFTIACLFIVTTFSFAQAPQAFNYSAVVRNGSGTPIPNQLVKFRLSILRGTITGPSVYVETHSTTTDGNGMVNLEIGRGTIVSGVFAAIPWNNDAFFFQVEVDPTGGNTFQLMGTTQFLSVPYALNAKYAENVAAQFGLFISADTLHVFRGDSTFVFANGSQYNSIGTYNAIIKWFGGNQEDFIFNVSNIPSGVTFVTPTSKSYTSSMLNNLSEFNVYQSLYVSNSATPGYYALNYSVTTASNRVVQKNFVLHILDDCELVNYLVGTRAVFYMFSPPGASCYYVKDTATFVANATNPTCGIALQFSNGSKLNFDINRRSLLINTTQNFGSLTTINSGYSVTFQNCSINSGAILKSRDRSLSTLPAYLWSNSLNQGYDYYQVLNMSGAITTTQPNPPSYCIGTISSADISIQIIR
ncbi:MAG TPA: hypothetical protein PLU17_13325 [Chitinophagaceae bacterium]|nr:hypothetical protein [Chitinophagaceae bacterium]